MNARPLPDSLRGPFKKLLAARDELRKAFPELSFALDGNLVGHIGEAIAISEFKLERLPAGSKTHDFKAPNGTQVQIRTTQQNKSGGGVGLGLVKTSFEHLIVIQLSESGTYSVLYDGPGRYIDEATKHKAGASLSVGHLQRLNLQISTKEKLCEDVRGALVPTPSTPYFARRSLRPAFKAMQDQGHFSPRPGDLDITELISQDRD
jgi:hypothetical protein